VPFVASCEDQAMAAWPDLGLAQPKAICVFPDVSHGGRAAKHGLPFGFRNLLQIVPGRR
jgi:hypothetical protein